MNSFQSVSYILSIKLHTDQLFWLLLHSHSPTICGMVYHYIFTQPETENQRSQITNPLTQVRRGAHIRIQLSEMTQNTHSHHTSLPLLARQYPDKNILVPELDFYISLLKLFFYIMILSNQYSITSSLFDSNDHMYHIVYLVLQGYENNRMQQLTHTHPSASKSCCGCFSSY